MKIKVINKRFQAEYIGIGLEGEYGVERYDFVLPRYYNQIDLAQGIAYLLYGKENGESGYVVLSKTIEDNSLSLHWIVGKQFTDAMGPVSLQIKISGLDSALWKSEIFTNAGVERSLEDPSPQQTIAPRGAVMASYSWPYDADGATDSIAPMIADPTAEPPITISERRIIIPPELQNIATQNDIASETVTIVLPRYFDGNDLSRHEIYLKTIMPGASESGAQGRDDIKFLNPVIEQTEIRLTWELRPPQTSYNGRVQLQLYVVDKATGGKTFKWETDPSASVNIYNSLDAEPALPNSPKLMDEFRQEMMALKASMEIQYDVQDYRVGFKRVDETEYKYTDNLKGDKGDPGDGDMRKEIYDPQDRNQDVFSYTDAVFASAMEKNVYDPQNKSQDIFRYVDAATSVRTVSFRGTFGEKMALVGIITAKKIAKHWNFEYSLKIVRIDSSAMGQFTYGMTMTQLNSIIGASLNPATFVIGPAAAFTDAGMYSNSDMQYSGISQIVNNNYILVARIYTEAGDEGAWSLGSNSSRVGYTWVGSFSIDEY